MPDKPKYISMVDPAVTKELDMGFYWRSAWRRLRDRFLKANPLCVRCLERDEVVPATHAHHVEERLDNPERALDETNLEALCGPCHSAHHARG